MGKEFWLLHITHVSVAVFMFLWPAVCMAHDATNAPREPMCTVLDYAWAKNVNENSRMPEKKCSERCEGNIMYIWLRVQCNTKAFEYIKKNEKLFPVRFDWAEFCVSRYIPERKEDIYLSDEIYREVEKAAQAAKDGKWDFRIWDFRNKNGYYLLMPTIPSEGKKNEVMVYEGTTRGCEFEINFGR